MWHEIAAAVLGLLVGGTGGVWLGMRYAHKKAAQSLTAARENVAKKN